ncbi:MAG TPA: autotransporter-associated beta strand repeat-containing protein [Verrucomicrobiae bacterium]|nr:autotransporter-associated beta strand repeat-containing protein [Verrucomicrobiae bacterium]
MKKSIMVSVQTAVIAASFALSLPLRATVTNIVCNSADYTCQPTSGVNNPVSSSTDAIGFAGSPGSSWCAILMFPLPTLPPGKIVGPQTTLSVTLSSIGASTTINGDLWGVANFRNTLPGATPDSTYWYYLANDTGPGSNPTPTDTKLMDNFLTPSLINQAGAIVSTPTGTTNNLQNYIQNFYINNPGYDASVSQAYVWVRINPDSASTSTANRYVIIAGDSSTSKPTLNLDIADIPTNTLVWNGNASAVWDDSTANWKSNNITGFVYQDGANVIFDDTFSANPAVTLDTTVLPTSVTVNNSVANYSISGSGNISGAASLLKLGTGTLVLDTDNDYSGGTILAGGVLQIGNGDTHGSIGSGPLTNNINGTALVFNRTDAISVNTITRNSSYNASIVVNSGSVSLGGTDDNSGTLATVNSGGTLILAKPSSSSAHALGSSSTINAGGVMQLGGTGGDQIYQSAYITNNGTFDLAGLSEGFNGMTGNGLVTNSAIGNSTLQLGDGGGTASFAGSIVDGAGAVALIKTGAGTQTLTGTNTYSGGTTVNGGKLVVLTSGNGGDYTVTNSATLGINVAAINAALDINTLNLGTAKIEFQSINSATVAPLQIGNLVLNGTVTINITNNSITYLPGQSYPLIAYTNLSGSGSFVIGTLPTGVSGSLDTSASPIKFVVSNVPVTWNGNVSGVWDINTTPNWKFGTLTGLVYPDNEPVTFDDTLSGTSSIDLEAYVNPISVTFSNSTHAYIVSGPGDISGPGLFTKTGTNILILDTDNDYYGGTVLSGGTLQIGNNDTHGNLGTGPLTNLVGGTILAFNRTDSITVNTITRTTVDNSAHIVVNSGIVSLGGTGDNAGTLATVNSGATLILAKDSSSTVHALSGIGGLVINPGGTMQLGGYGNDQIYTSSILTDNGTFDMAGYNEGFDGLNGNGIVTDSAGGSSTLQLGENNGSYTFDGAIVNGNGVLGLTKVGAGTLILTGASSYNGDTTVSTGKLVATTASTGGGNYTVADAATLGINVATANGSLNVYSLTLGASSLEFQNLNSTTTAAINAQAINQTGNVVINVTSGSLVAGQSYPLLSYSSSFGSGAFTLGTLPDGVTATLNTSASPITLQVSSVVNPTPTNIVTTYTNGTLTLQWPADHIGWLLESNSIDLGNTNDWFVIPNSSGTNVINIQVDPNSPHVFYRMSH